MPATTNRPPSPVSGCDVATATEGTSPIQVRGRSATQQTSIPVLVIVLCRSWISSGVMAASWASHATRRPVGLVASTSARQPSPATSSSASQPAARAAETSSSLSKR